MRFCLEFAFGKFDLQEKNLRRRFESNVSTPWAKKAMLYSLFGVPEVVYDLWQLSQQIGYITFG